MLNFDFSSWPSFTVEEANAVGDVLLSNKVNYWTGNQCREFEQEFAQFADTQYAVALANGTLALDIALKSLDIGKGDEVIVSSRTFIASVSSIINAGATPIFADVDLDSQNITAEFIAEKISKQTKAIVCVHLAGWACAMDEIMQLANQHHLKVIEDCAQAHGAKYKGKSVGSIGDIGCWSFCQDKIITTGGEGGMVSTNDKLLWKKMWSLKDHGKDYDLCTQPKTNSFNWLHTSLGGNARMTEIQAVIGRIQLGKMDDWHQKRLDNFNKIRHCGRKFTALRVADIPDYIEHAAYKCYVFVELDRLKDGWDRDKIIQQINKQGVPCYYGSCSEVYLESAFDNTKFKPKQRLTNAKQLGETALMFLVHPTLTTSEIQQTCDAIQSVVGSAIK